MSYCENCSIPPPLFFTRLKPVFTFLYDVFFFCICIHSLFLSGFCMCLRLSAYVHVSLLIIQRIQRLNNFIRSNMGQLNIHQILSIAPHKCRVPISSLTLCSCILLIVSIRYHEYYQQNTTTQCKATNGTPCIYRHNNTCLAVTSR